MSVFFRQSEERALSFQGWWGSGNDNPLVSGDQYKTALTLASVYAATGLIADALASSPWSVYDDSPGVPVKSKNQPDLVKKPGVNGLDLYSWKHQLVTSLMLWGNSYGYILNWDSKGIPSRVLWLRPDKVQVDESGPIPVYRLNGEDIERDRIIHVPWYVVPGSVVGLSPLSLFRLQIETGLEATKVGKTFFKRGGTVPPGVLKNTAKQLPSDVALDARDRFIASVSSSAPFVVGSDWDYTALGLPSSDVTFLTSTKATATQIAAIYRVAPEDVGGETSSGSLTYKNLEMDQIRFNVRTLRPVASRIESVVDPYLPPNEYNRFNLDAGVRADIKTRYDAHAVAIDAGFETRDEVRALEERAPLTPDQIEQIKDLRKAPSTIGTNA